METEENLSPLAIAVILRNEVVTHGKSETLARLTTAFAKRLARFNDRFNVEDFYEIIEGGRQP